MSESETGIELTERFEGCRLIAYQDSGGVWTIGFGHTKGVHEGLTCTQAQAEQWLCEDLAEAVADVNRLVKVPLTQGQFNSLVDFDFNLGGGALAHSTLLKLLNAGEYAAAAEQFERWDHVSGKVISGLLRRRLAEKAEFEGHS